MFDFFVLFLVTSGSIYWMWRRFFYPFAKQKGVVLGIFFCIFLVGASVMAARSRNLFFCDSTGRPFSLEEIGGQKVQTIRDLSKVLRSLEALSPIEILWKKEGSTILRKSRLSENKSSLVDFLQQANLGLRCLRPMVFNPPPFLAGLSEGYRRGSILYSLGKNIYPNIPWESIETKRAYPLQVITNGFRESLWVIFPDGLISPEDKWSFLGLTVFSNPGWDFSDEKFYELVFGQSFLGSLRGLGEKIVSSFFYSPKSWWQAVKDAPFAWYGLKQSLNFDLAFLIFLLAHSLILVLMWAIIECVCLIRWQIGVVSLFLLSAWVSVGVFL